jgi:hypothetical protein
MLALLKKLLGKFLGFYRRRINAFLVQIARGLTSLARTAVRVGETMKAEELQATRNAAPDEPDIPSLYRLPDDLLITIVRLLPQLSIASLALASKSVLIICGPEALVVRSAERDELLSYLELDGVCRGMVHCYFCHRFHTGTFSDLPPLRMRFSPLRRDGRHKCMSNKYRQTSQRLAGRLLHFNHVSTVARAHRHGWLVPRDDDRGFSNSEGRWTYIKFLDGENAGVATNMQLRAVDNGSSSRQPRSFGLILSPSIIPKRRTCCRAGSSSRPKARGFIMSASTFETSGPGCRGWSSFSVGGTVSEGSRPRRRPRLASGHTPSPARNDAWLLHPVC